VISSLTALFIVFAAVIGSSAMIGMIAYFLHRLRRIEVGSANEAGAHPLADHLADIQDELRAVQEDVSALSERLDFTEKLLMQSDEASASDDSE